MECVKEYDVRRVVFKCRPKRPRKSSEEGLQDWGKMGIVERGLWVFFPPTLPRAFLLWFVLHVRVSRRWYKKRVNLSIRDWERGCGPWPSPLPAVCDFVQVASALLTLVFPCLKWWVRVKWCLKVPYSSDILGLNSGDIKKRVTPGKEGCDSQPPPAAPIWRFLTCGLLILVCLIGVCVVGTRSDLMLFLKMTYWFKLEAQAL